MIPNKPISEIKYEYLMDYQKLFTGTEATICKTNTPFSVYKIFCKGYTPIPMTDNKVKKITNLYDMQVKHSVQPLCTISLNDVIIGYEMTSDTNLIKVQTDLLSLEEKNIS